jgi:polar amino acid transport system substrate-binding protein
MRHSLTLVLVGLLAFASLFAGQAARAERLDLIHKRGILIVGVKADYPPFGMRDANGQLVGFEPDLAAELARRLGLGLQLTAVTSTNRLQKLAEGAIDVVIATLGDTPQRRRIATLIEPHYYVSGVTVLAPPGARLSSWADLRGRKVCATQGAYFNREMAQRHLLDLQVFSGARDSRLALRDGRCIAWLYDDTALASLRLESDWADYRTPLPSTLVSPWAIAIAAAESGSRLERALADAVAEAHRSGWLKDAERRWNLPPSPFLADAQQRWTRIGADGQPICARLASGEWPAECRDASRLTSTEVSGLHRFGLLIRERTGLDLTFVYDPYDRSQFLRGIWLTVQLLIACIIGSLFVGCLGALTAESGIPFLRGWVWASDRADGSAAFAHLCGVFWRWAFGGHALWLDRRWLPGCRCLSFTVRGMFHGLRPARRQRSAQGTTTRFYPALENLTAGSAPGLHAGRRDPDQCSQSHWHGQRHRRPGIDFRLDSHYR